MKIIRTLDVTESAFYNHLERELLQDVEASTGKRLEASSIQPGFRYVKRQKKGKGQTQITVDDYQRGKCYQITSKSPVDTVTVTYLTEGKGEKTEVSLVEDIASYTPEKQNRFVRWFSQAMLLGRMSDTVMAMEDAILKEDTQKGLWQNPSI